MFSSELILKGDALELSLVTEIHENYAAIYSLRETSHLITPSIYIVVGAIYLTQPENQASAQPAVGSGSRGSCLHVATQCRLAEAAGLVCTAGRHHHAMPQGHLHESGQEGEEIGRHKVIVLSY